MREWRLLRRAGAGAAEGLAVDEALMRRYHAGPSAPTLRLYTYRSHCALIGRFQDAAELNLQACAATGTEVNRRPTGGGAIVMGEDQLGVAAVASLSDPDVPQHARAIIARFGEGVARGLARLGIEGEVRGKNDIAVAGRKIAGLGVYTDAGGAVLFHASVLVDLDIEFMLRVLRIPIAKLADKAVSSVRERITTVRTETGRAVTTHEVRAAVAAGFAETFQTSLVPDAMDDADRAATVVLMSKRYGRREWLLERAAGTPEGTSLVKTPGGLLRVSVALGGDAIAHALISGDFMAGDRAVAELEAALRWCGTDRGRIADALMEGARRGGGLAGVPIDDLAEAVWQAVLEARARRGAAGSCYYPQTATAAASV